MSWRSGPAQTRRSRISGVISFPAPVLCQFADEELLIEIGSTIFPSCIKRWRGENGLRIWVEGDPSDLAAGAEALARFQIVLGVLRAWRPIAGELCDERRTGLGERSVRDEAGNQWVTIGPAIDYRIAGGEIEKLAASATRSISASQNLRGALQLNGRANRTAAEFYMIYEYAKDEFGGPKGIRTALGLSLRSQSRLTSAANRLSPLLGGRHVRGSEGEAMGLDEQRESVAQLLLRWMEHYN
jgi:hypothetical protein